MNKLNDYIKIGINNGFKKYKTYKNFVIDFGNKPDFIFSNILAQNREIEVIMSIEFITAVAKYHIWSINKITEEQAIAIRDGKLEEFITKYLNGG